jgi:hypothetical protein
LIVALAVSVSAYDGLMESSASKTNLEIFDKSISGELEKFYFLPEINRNYQFVFYVTVNNISDAKLKGAKEYITGLIKKTAGRNNLNFSIAKDTGSFRSDSAFYRVNLVINKMRTSYPKFVKNKFLGEKIVQRNIFADLSVVIFSSDGKFQINDGIHVDLKDEVDYENIEQLETEEYSFTQAPPPEVNSIEAVMFPVAIVLISAAATILFFTIRTK